MAARCGSTRASAGLLRGLAGHKEEWHKRWFQLRWDHDHHRAVLAWFKSEKAADAMDKPSWTPSAGKSAVMLEGTRLRMTESHGERELCFILDNPTDGEGGGEEDELVSARMSEAKVDVSGKSDTLVLCADMEEDLDKWKVRPRQPRPTPADPSRRSA